MLLSNMLTGITHRILQGSASIEISGVTDDTRAVSRGMVFCCIRGQQVDGHDLCGEAVKNGAYVLVTERPLNGIIPYHVTVVQVSDSREVTGLLAAAYYGHPAESMTMIGITGTKGKTTMSFLLWKLLRASGVNCGLIGTNGAYFGDNSEPISYTTPTACVLQRLLYEMKKAGCEAVVMEVSSIGMKEKRCAGLTFEYGIFTNFAADHIGGSEHRDMEEYFYWKSKLFSRCRCAIVNLDEPKSLELYRKNRTEKEPVERWIGYGSSMGTFGREKLADWYKIASAQRYETESVLGMSFALRTGGSARQVQLSMPGAYNVSNAAGAIACAEELLCRKGKLLDVNALSDVQISGRTEMVEVYHGAKILVDYAHNAAGLEHVLTSLRDYCTGRIICVFGCGGGRSRVRRRQMGEVSDRLADEIILTEDNSREEDVRQIIRDISGGIRRKEHCQVIEERREAIGQAIRMAQPGDLVLIAGKGHEEYQERNGVRSAFSDREAVRQWTKAEKGVILK